VPKLDSLIKHLGLKKCLVTRPGIVVGEFFLSPSNVHVKNEKVYVTIGQFSVIDWLQNGGKAEKKKKMQFVALWHLLKHGRSMTNFEEFKQLFQILKVENYLQK
jgi:hypothetical protein